MDLLFLGIIAIKDEFIKLISSTHLSPAAKHLQDPLARKVL